MSKIIEIEDCSECKESSDELEPCKECGMPCAPKEYHPYAACLMFKACHNSKTVRVNLDFVRNSKPEYKYATKEDAWVDGGTSSIWVEGWCVGFNAAREETT